jgi:hypothetical protein
MSAVPAVYRDPDLCARSERDALVLRRDRELAGAGPVLRAFRRRVTRIAAGGMLAVAGSAMWLSVLAAKAAEGLESTSWRAAWAPLAIPVAWSLAALAALVAGALVAGRLALRYPRVSASDDPWRDLQRLTELPTIAALRRRATQLETASVLWPLVGLALLAPISIHCVVAVVAGSGKDFAIWMGLSAIIAGPAHVALVICAVRFARRLRDRPRSEIVGAGWRALWITTIVSTVPFALMLAIPPLLVLVTGLVFIPWSFGRMLVVVERERIALHQPR